MPVPVKSSAQNAGYENKRASNQKPIFRITMRSDNPKNNKNVAKSLKNNKNVATSDSVIAFLPNTVFIT
jgi:hypothetical protein